MGKSSNRGSEAAVVGPPDAAALAAENEDLRRRVEELEAALADSTESALRLSETEQRYAELLRLSPYGVLIQEDGRVSYINDRGLRILGAHVPGEIVGRQPKEFVPADAQATFWDRDTQLRRTGGVPPARYSLLRLDGARIEIEVASVLLKRGQRYGALTVFEDVTQRVEAEQAAQEFAERYRMISELTSDFIYLDRIEPDGRPVPLWVTGAFTRITGYAMGELQPEEILTRLVHPDDFAAASAHIERLLSGVPDSHVMRLVTRDRAVRWVRHIARPIADADAGRVTLLYGSVRDVTEAYEAREQLYLNEERLHEAQRIAQVGSWEADITTNTLTWSDECYRIFGQRRGAFQPTNEAFFAAVHPDDLERVQAASEAARRTGTLYEVEHRIVRPDGAVRHVHERAELRRGPDGKPALMLGTVLDITERVLAGVELQTANRSLQEANRLLQEEVAERRRVEAEARDFADRYRVISELSDEFIGLSEVTAEGRLEFLWLTGAFERMTGYTLEETRHPGFLERLAPEDYREQQREHVAAALRNEPTTTEGKLCTKSGREIWIRSTLQPIWDESAGRVTHLYGCVRDISQQRLAGEELQAAYAALEDTNRRLEAQVAERLQAEQSLRESETRYRELVEGMGEGLVVTDLEERVLYANPTAERIFGLTAGGLNGHNLCEFMDEATFAKVRNESQRRLRGEPSVYDFQITRSDGDPRRLRASVSPLRSADGVVHATMGVFADVTEQEQLRTRLQEEQREESIIMLAGGLAHDFNNMLMGVKGATALLETALATDDADVQDLIKAIQTSAERMADLTKKLLAYARGGKYQTRIVNLNEAVRNADLMLRGNVPSRVRVELELAEALWPVEADAGQIEQVLLNLCINAFESIDASSAGGLVRISTANEQTAQIRPAPPRLPQSALCVRVSVVDTGGGMDPETLERVFEPFFSTKFHGRGLGLAASSGIVRNHGGVIWAESTPGQGTAFHLLLPAAHRTAEEDRAAVLAAIPDGASALVVDDDPAALDITRRMLENMGFEVYVATDGAAGLATFRKFGASLSLVLADLQMHDMTGVELLRQLRAVDPEVRVVICSGKRIEDALYEIGKISIDGFLAKPFSPHELAQTLAQVLTEDAAEAAPPSDQMR
jgi:PAS domain S-box-containing protein